MEKKFHNMIFVAVRNNSLCLDIAILNKTIGSIFDFSNVNSSKDISMPSVHRKRLEDMRVFWDLWRAGAFTRCIYQMILEKNKT